MSLYKIWCHSTDRKGPASLDELDARQPLLLLFGEQKKKFQRIFIDVDQEAIPSDAQRAVTAFDGTMQSSSCPQLLL